jgi:hypothetical protein
MLGALLKWQSIAMLEKLAVACSKLSYSLAW